MTKILGNQVPSYKDSKGSNINRLEETLGLFDSVFKPKSWAQVAEEAGWIRNSDGSYSVEGDVDLTGMELTEIPVTFKDVGGSFLCGDNYLTSLEGSPYTVGGSFVCSHNQLTSLDGAPHVIGKYLYCFGNCFGNQVPEVELK